MNYTVLVKELRVIPGTQRLLTTKHCISEGRKHVGNHARLIIPCSPFGHQWKLMHALIELSNVNHDASDTM